MRGYDELGILPFHVLACPHEVWPAGSLPYHHKVRRDARGIVRQEILVREEREVFVYLLLAHGLRREDFAYLEARPFHL